MLIFLYNMNYDDEISKAIAESEALFYISLLELHVSMFVFDDRYDISDLRDVVVNRYSSRCITFLKFLKFIKFIYDVYERTSISVRQLSDTTYILMRKNFSWLLNDESFSTIYEKILIEISEFKRDILDLYVKASIQRLQYT